jgi:hypothetical protein
VHSGSWADRTGAIGLARELLLFSAFSEVRRCEGARHGDTLSLPSVVWETESQEVERCCSRARTP